MLPRPTYTASDGCSDNSSCLSAAQARTKCSVSSGYESLAPDSAELDVSPTATPSQERITTSSADKKPTPGKSSAAGLKVIRSYRICSFGVKINFWALKIQKQEGPLT